MKITVLDGYALNPGDLSWDSLATLGDLQIFDRTPAAEVAARASGAAEVLIHSYFGWSDSQVLGTQLFLNNNLWNNSQGSTTITTWMSTDCTCTPGQPGPPPTGCKPANSAAW
jgi:hypothetical protein